MNRKNPKNYDNEHNVSTYVVLINTVEGLFIWIFQTTTVLDSRGLIFQQDIRII